MDINLKAYNNLETIKYYKGICDVGLLKYEEEIIDKYFNSGNVLDLGCGAGRTTKPLVDKGFNTIGIDYSSNMILAAKKLFPGIDFRIGDVRKLEFVDNSFANIFFSFNGLMLLKNYSERRRAMKEIYRILKRNGIFFFTTPYLDNKVNEAYWNEKIRQQSISLSLSEDKLKLGDEVIEEGTVKFFIHIPFLNEIEKLIKDCGFETIFQGSRIENYGEENIEDELDDNYIWVVKK